MALDCHVIYQDHVTKRSSNFMSGSCLRYVTILPSLNGYIYILCVSDIRYNGFNLSRDFARLRDQRVM